MKPLFDPRVVHLSPVAEAGYGLIAGMPPPELPSGTRLTTALDALRHLWHSMGLDASHHNTVAWNPLQDLIGNGRRILVKPNWVRHEHSGGGNLDSLITHTSLVEGLLHYLVKTAPVRLVVGDAPLQGCDFATLRSAAGIDELHHRFSTHGTPFELADFRRTIATGNRLDPRQQADCRELHDFVLFDLGTQSALEPITADNVEFRVTQYDPRRLQETHCRGRHRYLVAREVLDADVVINVPKLKTHKKSGITGTLKNLVGINGHKEYLPHHRRGSAADGGDCYATTSWLKRQAESCLDSMNEARAVSSRRLWGLTAHAALRSHRWLGGDGDVEGSWHGNDTIWRTCLDLQRILHFGRPDGSLADEPQRQILHVTDAIIAGEGDGPLTPDPVPLGLLTCGTNPAAVEWVHAWLMGFEPNAIPLVREAFGSDALAWSDFTPAEIHVRVAGKDTSWEELDASWTKSFRAPAGWQGYCERERS